MKMNTLDYVKTALIVIVLLFGLVFALTATNIMHCSSLGKTWCNAYWSMIGPPKVLIVFGNDGLGDAAKLSSILQDKEIFGVRAQMQNIDYIQTTDYLKNYKIVIVTQAKTMSSDKIKMFQDYAAMGFLIWTGDAGTLNAPGDKKPSDYNFKVNDPWTRVTNDEQLIQFGKDTLSAQYIDNYCNYVNCIDYYKDFVGFLVGNPNSDIANGIPKNLEFKGNFAMVTLINNTSLTTKTTMDISLDRKGVNLIGKNPDQAKGLGSVLPIMIRSGVGKNTVYLASPIEYLIDAKDSIYGVTNTGNNIPATIEKLFDDYTGN
jgi:hypothetical protein